MPLISVVQLGRVDYAEGLRLQRKLVDLHKAGQIGDVLLLLEHTPVITLGRNAKAGNVLATPEALTRRGVEVFECDRGGDVTFHGPGQIVGYPIFDLRGFERGSSQRSAVSSQPLPPWSQVAACRSQEETPDDSLCAATSSTGAMEKVSEAAVLSGASVDAEPAPSATPVTRKTLGAVDYVRRLEEVLIRTCADFRIPAKRVAGLTGVWTDGETGTPARPTSAPSPALSVDVESADVGTGAPARPSGAELRGDFRRNPENFAAEAKIAAIGVHISRSVTSHGFALNVNTDLSFFNLIVPCGIAAKPVTSMQKELGREVETTAVAESLSRNFGTVFGRQMLWVDTLDALLGNTVGVPMKEPGELRALRGEEDLFLA